MKYSAQKGSKSGHCCFDFTIVDSEQQEIINGEPYFNTDGEPVYSTICECFTEQDARLVLEALNKESEYRKAWEDMHDHLSWIQQLKSEEIPFPSLGLNLAEVATQWIEHLQKELGNIRGEVGKILISDLTFCHDPMGQEALIQLSNAIQAVVFSGKAPEQPEKKPVRICNTCKGTGVVKGLHDWRNGSKREQACWNCHEEGPEDA